MKERFGIGVMNHGGRALPMRTDIGDDVIPAGEMAKPSIIGSHFVEVYDAGDEREVRIAIVPDDCYNDK